MHALGEGCGAPDSVKVIFLAAVKRLKIRFEIIATDILPDFQEAVGIIIIGIRMALATDDNRIFCRNGTH